VEEKRRMRKNRRRLTLGSQDKATILTFSFGIGGERFMILEKEMNGPTISGAEGRKSVGSIGF
jgi:hypothetical protein